MNKIDMINLNKTNFKGTQKMENHTKSLDKSLDESVRKILERAQREVPEYGDFAPVYEQLKNPDKSLCATDFVIKIVKPPKNIENHEKIRNLEVSAYKIPQPYKAERIITTGSKDEILKALSKKDLPEQIKSALISLSEDLEDI